MLRSFTSLGEQLLKVVNLKSLPFIIIGVGIAVRVHQYILAKSLWLDESFLALNIVNKSFAELLKPLDYNQVAPVGFLFIEKLSVQLLGNNEYALRLFPFLCGIISLFLFFQIAKRLLGKEAFLIALTLFSLSGYLICYSAQVKQYSIDVTTILLLYATTLYFQSQRPEISHAASFGIIGAAAVWFSHPSVFVLAGIGICLSLFSLIRKEWREVGQLSMVHIIWLLSFAVFYLITFHHDTSTGNIEAMQDAWVRAFAPFPPTSLSDAKWYITTFFHIFENPVGLHFAGIATLVFIIGCASMFLKNKQWFCLLLSPILITLIVSGFHLYPFRNRLLLFIVPAVLLFIAEGAGTIVNKTRYTFPAIGILLLCLLLSPPVLEAGYKFTTQNTYRLRPVEDIKPVMHYIREHKNDGDVLYLYYGSSIAFKYYANHFRFTNNEYIVGTRSRQDLEKYTKELDTLRGNKRVWLLFSHVIKVGGVDEESFFLRYLDCIGKRINQFKGDGAAAYLYDLSDNTHATQTDF